MTSIASTKVTWQVQVRKSRNHHWVNKGRFETRAAARWSAYLNRTHYRFERGARLDPAGFGNTRVVRK